MDDDDFDLNLAEPISLPSAASLSSASINLASSSGRKRPRPDAVSKVSQSGSSTKPAASLLDVAANTSVKTSPSFIGSALSPAISTVSGAPVSSVASDSFSNGAPLRKQRREEESRNTTTKDGSATDFESREGERGGRRDQSGTGQQLPLKEGMGTSAAAPAYPAAPPRGSGGSTQKTRTSAVFDIKKMPTAPFRAPLPPREEGGGGGGGNSRVSSAAFSSSASSRHLTPTSSHGSGIEGEGGGPESAPPPSDGGGGKIRIPNSEELLRLYGVRIDENAAAAAAVTFTSLALDSRLIEKLVAAVSTTPSVPPPDSQKTSATKGAPAASSDAAASGGGGNSNSAAAGISRGHLRDGFGLARPTRVQRITIPVALSPGLSVCVRSETGSGKTLAFLLPIVHALLQSSASSSSASAFASSGGGRSQGTQAIILAPTRELCGQIFQVATRLLQPFPHLVPGHISGGEKRKSEKARLRKGITLLCATPGRLLDHLRTTEAFETVALRHLVLDEADRLLDMGFGPQITSIVTLLRDRCKRAARGEDKKKGGAGGKGTGSPGPTAEMEGTAAASPASSSTKNTWRTILLSATMSSSVQELAASILGRGEEMLMLDAAVTKARTSKAAVVGEGYRGSIATGGASAVPAPVTAVADAGSNSSVGGKKISTTASVVLTSATSLPSSSTSAQSSSNSSSSSSDSSSLPLAPSLALTAASSSSASSGPAFSIPSTLHQIYYIVPLKWRLVTLLGTIFDSCKRATRLKAAAASSSEKSAAATVEGSAVELSSSPLTAASAAARGGAKIILFVSTTASVDFHYSIFSWFLPRMLLVRREGIPEQAPFPVYRLHGNIDQTERTGTYRSFAAASQGLLIATDVASRGLDLPAVDVIVQADAPSDTSEYVHRVGRTARRGEKGESIIFLLPHESSYVDILSAAGLRLECLDSAPPLACLSQARSPAPDLFRLDEGGDGVMPATLSRIAEAARESTLSAASVSRRGEMQAAFWQGLLEEAVPRLPQLKGMAREGFASFVRAYATHDRSTRHIFHPRALHLGHAAKAFGLLETPTLLVSRLGAAGAAGGEQQQQQQQQHGGREGGGGTAASGGGHASNSSSASSGGGDGRPSSTTTTAGASSSRSKSLHWEPGKASVLPHSAEAIAEAEAVKATKKKRLVVNEYDA